MPPSSSKRKRASEADLQQIPDKHSIFTHWAQDRGVEINGVKAAHIPGRGIGLQTTGRVKKGERLIFIPEKAMFKPDPSLPKQNGLKNISPQAHLAVSAVLNFHGNSGELEIWSGVLPSLSQFNESMPMLWPKSLLQHLPPPVHQPLERQFADYKRDWETVQAFVTKMAFGELDFKYWWLIVNSRSFHWKPPHGRGVVMVMCPFIDYMNHGPTGSTCNVTMIDDGYEVVADRNYAPGEEILATYGPHSNDKLLVHYGFICSFPYKNPIPDDDIRLDHVILPKLSTEDRSRLQDVGFLGGYAYLPTTNELCFKTQVAIRATILSANEWEYFMQNGEDIGEDQTYCVEKIVQDMCAPYVKQIEHETKALRGLEQSPMTAVMSERWEQILDCFNILFRKIYNEEVEEDERLGRHMGILET